MSDFSKQFNKILNNAEKATNRASYRALNKSIAKIKTKYQRGLIEHLGLKSAIVKSRLNMRKASSKSLVAYTGFGTKFKIALSEFKPKSINVKVALPGQKGKKRQKKRKYKGATAQLPESPRETVPGAWIWKAKSGKSLIIARKNAAEMYPLKQPKEDMAKYALKLKPGLDKELAADFKRQFSQQLKHELGTGS